MYVRLFSTRSPLFLVFAIFVYFLSAFCLTRNRDQSHFISFLGLKKNLEFLYSHLPVKPIGPTMQCKFITANMKMHQTQNIGNIIQARLLHNQHSSSSKAEFRNETTTISPSVNFGPYGSGGTITGYSKYDGIRHAFEEIFAQRLELGTQLVIYQDGEKIVDLHGCAPEQKNYDGDTLQCVYSSGKNMESIAMAMLVDRGLLCYDDLVSKYWPEFGTTENRRENVTVANVMRHEGGVPFLADPDNPTKSTLVVTPEDVQSIDELEDKICNAPKYPSFEDDNTKNGRMYHAITRGWIVNGILRRVDPSGRTLGVFIKEEICDKLGITFFCGIPIHEQDKYQYANMAQSGLLYDTLFQLGPACFGYGEPELWRLTKALVHNKDSMVHRRVTSWMKPPPTPDFNDTQLGRSIEIPSAGMFANARSMAKINSVMAGDGSCDGIQLLSTNAVLESMDEVKVSIDTSLSSLNHGIESSYGMTKGGFGVFDPWFEGDLNNKIMSPDDKKAFENMIGWGGWGGSLSLWDKAKNVSFAYTPNAMGMNLLGGHRQRRILLELQKHI